MFNSYVTYLNYLIISQQNLNPLYLDEGMQEEKIIRMN